MQRARILILWNQIDEDVYAHYRRDGRRAPDWDPKLEIEPWETVEEEMQLIERCLAGVGHEVKTINIRDNLWTMTDAIRDFKPDAVMNLVEFFHDDPEQEHHIPALFELLGVAYSGNRPIALSMCQKKPHAKAVLAAANLPTPRGILVESATGGQVPAELTLRYPLMVKPAFDDASGGIDAGSVVHTRADLEARVAHVLKEHRGVLVEEFIDGREIHCAILGDQPLPLCEIEFKGGLDDVGRVLPNIITYRAKWDPYSRDHHAVQTKCPAAGLDPKLVAHIQDVAVRAYRALGCRDYARVDMRLDKTTGEIFILEVNPNPDLADSCAFANSVRASGRTYQDAICEIAGFAIDRARNATKVVSAPDSLLREYLARRARV